MENWRGRTTKAGRTVGLLSVVAGLVGAGLLVVHWVIPYLSISLAGIHIVDGPANLGAENAPLVTFWAIVIGILALVTGYVVWMDYVKVLWVLAVVLPVLTILGLFSIGLFIAPFAVLVIASSILLTIGSRDGIPAT